MTYRWHMLTGEYPPQPGGVSDYSAQVAAAMGEAGAEVQVWAPPADGPTPEFAGVIAHCVEEPWSPAGLKALGALLDDCPGPRRLLVQYTPNAWGYKSMNFGFPRWLVGRRRGGDDVWLMIHEAFYPIILRDKPTRWLLPWAHRLMMRGALAASSRVFTSTPHYATMVKTQDRGRDRPITWLPVPSNIPPIDDPRGVAALRGRIAPAGQAIVGSFGNYPRSHRDVLQVVLPALLQAGPDRVVLLLGRLGLPFAAQLKAARPDLADRIIAPGGLDAAEASRHLQVCDVMLQPYEEGVCTRRGTVMAGLAHGAAIVTTLGHLSEPLWAETGCVAAIPSAPDRAGMIRAAEGLLRDRGAREQLGARARAVYGERFALSHTIRALLEA